MRIPLPNPWTSHADLSLPVIATVCAAFTVASAGVALASIWFWAPLAALLVAGVGILAFRHTTAFCIVWLVVAGATLEMTLNDLVGPAAFQSTIAAVKSAELVLAAICVIRFGLSPDIFNPGFAFLAMFIAGVAHGLHPSLTLADSARSLLGSVAPFAFAFSRLPAGWGRAMIRTTIWLPLISVAGGAVLDMAGLRPLFVDSGGERLAGLGHPAFLASICVAAMYACLIELYREGRSRWLLPLAMNLVFLMLTGARAPLTYAVAVSGIAFLTVPSSAFPAQRRVVPLLLAACVVPLLAVLAGELSVVRLFNLLTGEAGNLSGRDLLWPAFEQAAAGSPWFGWGIGAGNAIIPPDSDLVRLIQSWAAHNEYLRIEVEGGQLGRGLLVAMFVLWVVRHTARLGRTDKAIMRLVFLGFAAHAYTDNVLISTPACVFFVFAIAVFVSGRLLRTAKVA